MGLPKYLSVALLSLSVTVCASSIVQAKVTVKQIEKAETVEELVALGATQLSAGQFKELVVGKPLADAGKGWTWIIDGNGTTSSAAADGSWKEDNAPWKMKGNAYCTNKLCPS